MMVCGGLVSVGTTVWADVDHSGDRHLEGVVELMFDGVSGLVPGGHRHLGIDGDRGGDVELMALPADLQLGDFTDPVDTRDHSLGLVDDFWFDTVEKSACHRPSRPNEKSEDDGCHYKAGHRIDPRSTENCTDPGGDDRQ